jgi:hypothetical protein
MGWDSTAIELESECLRELKAEDCEFVEEAVLELRPNCECCNKDLPPSTSEAMICSFECTFCRECTDKLLGRCPNCGGGFELRPTRPEALLQKYPASQLRVIKPEACAPELTLTNERDNR